MANGKTNRQALDESTAVAQRAAEMIGGTFEEGVGFTPGTDLPTTTQDKTPQDTAPGTATPASSEAIISTLTQRLLGDSGAVSSQDSAIEQQINRAIGATQRGQEASRQRIESQFAREREFRTGESVAELEGTLEGRTGMATAQAAYNRLVKVTDKEIKDLEQRKQELILQGEASAAQRISELQVEKLRFQEKAKQRAFDNLLGVGNLAIRGEAEDRRQREFQATQERLSRQQLFEEEKAIRDIQLEFPEAEIPEGATLQEAVEIARPFAQADKEREQELERIESTAKQKVKEVEEDEYRVYSSLYGDTYADLRSQGLSPREAFEEVQILASEFGNNIPIEAFSSFQTLESQISAALPEEEVDAGEEEEQGVTGAGLGLTGVKQGPSLLERVTSGRNTGDTGLEGLDFSTTNINEIRKQNKQKRMIGSFSTFTPFMSGLFR